MQIVVWLFLLQMKYLLTIVALYLMTIACNSINKEKKEERKITSRDYSITASISYTDIFLDSMAVEKYLVTNSISDTLSNRIRSFYNSRNFQFAWLSSDGLTEQGRSFWNLQQYYNTYSSDSLLYSKKLQKSMNAFVSNEQLTVNPTDSNTTNTEIALTDHFIQYILLNYKEGDIKRKEVEQFVPYKRKEILYLADSLLSQKHADHKYYADVNMPYKQLFIQLQKYYDIAKKGGWQPIPINKQMFNKVTANTMAAAIKSRLLVTGELAVKDTTSLITEPLKNAIKSFQSSHGITPDGKISQALLNEMNVPVIKRIEQLLMNMGRMRWIPDIEEGNIIIVNIPEFRLHVFEANKTLFDMNVVVGKEGHGTTVFIGNLDQVVFSPYWNVTANIVQKEMLPSIQKNPNYLAENNLEITGQEDGLPIIRQLPGAKNSLGKVKFLFPNSFDIYLHDTPVKSLFNNDVRAFSHGCIRLADPFALARYVLRKQPEWTPENITKAMNAGEEKFVKVKEPIPVLITYFTAWVDKNGLLNFRNDIYGHDAMLAKKMFTNPQ